jgi:dienelactone hydrolase
MPHDNHTTAPNPHGPQAFDFSSHGQKCAGRLWRPPAGQAPHPVVILAAGLGGTQSMRLPVIAERFQQAGFAAVTFDYRYFGDSAGRPRQLLDIAAQRQDWNAAIDAVKAHPELDANRVALWGTSFAGGHVLTIAAQRRDIAAVIAQGPFTDGLASARTVGVISTAKVGVRALSDVASRIVGGPPVYVESFGRRRSAALMTAPDAIPGVQRLVAEAPHPADTRIAARVALHIGLDAPGRRLRHITAPALIQVCRGDSVAPDTATLRHIANAQNPRITASEVPFGHFDIYFGEAFDHVAAAQIHFLRSLPL